AWAKGTSTLGGGLDLNLGTYTGTSHQFRTDAVFEVTHVKWKERAFGKFESHAMNRYVKVTGGAELGVPRTRAVDHGLPVPAGDPLPGKDGERHYIDGNLAFAASYIEKIDARTVLPAITNLLSAKLLRNGRDDVQSDLVRGLKSAFSEEA